MSGTDYKFEGYAAMNKETALKGGLEWVDYTKDVKPFDDDDVDIEIQYAGICASDLHTMSGGQFLSPAFSPSLNQSSN